MTVSTTTNKVFRNGNGVASSFSYPFKIFETSDLVVIKTDVDSVDTVLVLDSDYSVSGAGDDAGGDVTYPISGSLLATGEKLTIYRDIPEVQETDLRNQGAWNPQVIEDQLDRNIMISQELHSNFDRTLQFSETEDRSANTNLIPTPESGHALIWNDEGDLENLPLSISSANAALFVDSLAQLKALDVGTVVDAFIRGAVTPLDGKQNRFYYDAASSSTPDDQLVVKPNSVTLPATGRWIAAPTAAALTPYDNSVSGLDAEYTQAAIDEVIVDTQAAIDEVIVDTDATNAITLGARSALANISVRTGKWTARTAAEANSWEAITWSPELGLFCAVANTGTNRVMTSPDGITWTARTAAEANQWEAITWSPGLGLFCAVANTGTNRVMTSPDGITWTARTAAEANSWEAITWSPELSLFCAVASGATNRVMTSPDGITWTARADAEANSWEAITWSPELGLFCAVANTGTNRVMTSPDGITWTARTAAEANSWYSVTWSPELSLFCAVSYTGTNRVMTSPDGITWTARTAAEANSWEAITWSPELGLFCAVANTGTNRVMTSPDGITWTGRTAAENNSWLSVTWSPGLGLFCAVAFSGTNRVMHSL